MSGRKPRILIIEDEDAIRLGLMDVFIFHGYEVDYSADGAEGLAKAKQGNYDLLLVDVMLPSLDGFSICNQVRALDRNQPIILLTAKTTEEDIITGLTHGADDYIGKPFSVRQLVLRVEAVLRRSRKLEIERRTIEIGTQLRIDSATLEGTLSHTPGEVIAFTRRELEVLQYLLEHTDRPVSREELLEEVWGYKRGSQIETRTVDIHIAKLRKKIEKDPKEPTLLLTVRGEGYRVAQREES